ncbi:hypothetical protein EVAR_13684_1 [Eumeta japonica]|uniref:Uncharacterized protein n=1 Tax=Eumeta variegata TaxID=151549 RepID=A0A4C1UBK3_EUMVA|nr:hypothetical protein EVAR_13684_1 [Eumeta japonica]
MSFHGMDKPTIFRKGKLGPSRFLEYSRDNAPRPPPVPPSFMPRAPPARALGDTRPTLCEFVPSVTLLPCDF